MIEPTKKTKMFLVFQNVSIDRLNLAGHVAGKKCHHKWGQG